MFLTASRIENIFLFVKNSVSHLKNTWNLTICSKVYIGGWDGGSRWRGSVSSVQSLSRVRLFVTPWTEARQASLSIINSWSPPKPMSIESMMPFNHLILCRALLLMPASGSFPMSQLFVSGGQSTGVSASTSVLPMNTQD